MSTEVFRVHGIAPENKTTYLSSTFKSLELAALEADLLRDREKITFIERSQDGVNWAGPVSELEEGEAFMRATISFDLEYLLEGKTVQDICPPSYRVVDAGGQRVGKFPHTTDLAKAGIVAEIFIGSIIKTSNNPNDDLSWEEVSPEIHAEAVQLADQMPVSTNVAINTHWFTKTQ